MAYSVVEDLKIYNIICYLRKSRQDVEREKRTGEDTLSEQEKLMTRILNDYSIPYITKKEIGSGDKISTRPVFQEILEELKLGKYDAIAVKEVSRLGRGSYKDMGEIYDLLCEKRIFIITPWKIYDPLNEADKRQIRFELFLSREEFETIRSRLMGARYNYAMEGKWMAGAVPFGYKFNPTTQKLDINEDDAKVVRLIFDLFTNGLNGKKMGVRAIATYLKRIGVKTPTGKIDWNPLVIHRMLLKPVYIGQVVFRQYNLKDGKKILRPKEEWIVVTDAHEPIITEDIWLQAQQRINNNRENNAKVKLDFSPCELASLIVCKKCGKKMIRQYSVQHYEKQDGSTSIYEKEFLWCGAAGCTFVKYRDAEKQLLSFLETFKEMNDSNLNEVVTSILNSKPTDNHNSINKEEIIKNIEQRKKELKNRLDFIAKKHFEQVYTDEDYTRFREQILKEIKELDKAILPEEKKKEENIIDVKKIRNNITTIINLYNDLIDKTHKNKLLHEIFEVVYLEVLEKGRGQKSTKFKLTPEFKIDFLV